MPYEERVKAQGKYFNAEIAKLEEAIKDKFDEKKNYKGKHEGWTPKKGAGKIPPTVTVKVPGDGEYKIVNSPDGIAKLKKIAATFKAPPKKGKAAPMQAPVRPPSIKVAAKPESAEKETEPFVAGKGDSRPQLQKPYVENGMVYASNGSIMVRRPLRKGEKVNGKGPESAKIIDSIPFDNPDKLDVAATYPKIVQALATTSKATKGGKESSSGIKVYRGKDGSIHFRSRDLEGNAYATDNWAKDSEFIGRIDGEYMKNVLELAAKSGAKEIEIAFNKGKDAKDGMSAHFRAGEWEVPSWGFTATSRNLTQPKPGTRIRGSSAWLAASGKRAFRRRTSTPTGTTGRRRKMRLTRRPASTTGKEDATLRPTAKLSIESGAQPLKRPAPPLTPPTRPSPTSSRPTASRSSSTTG